MRPVGVVNIVRIEIDQRRSLKMKLLCLRIPNAEVKDLESATNAQDCLLCIKVKGAFLKANRFI